MRRLLALLPFVGLGCAVPHRELSLPPSNEAWIAVLSGEMPVPISGVARHAWIVGQLPGARRMRWELGEVGRTVDSETLGFFGSGEIALHGIVRESPFEIDRIARCLDESTAGYPKRHPDYFPIPGPNSNTIIAEALRHCDVHVELPATCIGRDYLGPVGVAVTEAGTGVQAESWVIGARIGLKEGVEVHMVSLALGVHFWPPGITVPLNPAGRIGLDFDSYRSQAYVEPVVFEHDERQVGTSSAWLSVKGAWVKDPDRAGGLRERTTLNLSGRALLAKKRFGYAFGADLELGAGFPLGFAYLAHLYPVGAGVAFGETGYFMVLGGFGASGVSARVPGAFEVPVEARLEFDVTEHARMGLRGALIFAPDSDDRRRESVIGVFTRFGRTSRRYEFIGGHGPWLSLERHEVIHTYWLGLSLGTEIDFGG